MKDGISMGDDYYLEDGRVHFTQNYLLERGPCCGGSCRHCPYDAKVKGNTTIKRSDNLN